MQENSPTLTENIIKTLFQVVKDKDELFELLYSETFPVIGIENNKITDIINLNGQSKKLFTPLNKNLNLHLKRQF